ncbi:MULTISPECIES: hypothetical protein [Alphaproteobacteria]|uniref:Yip1 domain-containing protein n=2 Tax=Alphaproteobacteria TaxID=28211 RepID=A0A512HDT0_9HYPH|nr:MULTISPECIES: hypothetical protein [Alphaproteobacteria]GEO83612.1 hypothetical protein RNA01_05440 [Ciceribacter naphthalenivorans]GLR24236.1 hypothetical protein GCM10007920_40300 [Ciceribacter naphthalenivorans]GLT07092.1 hypothetical protein GCM10007926_40300 [Sphingomonas psychrolutea]
MPTLKEVEIYLTGLWLLFKQDPKGLAHLDFSDRGALRSFWAAFFALPTMLLTFAWWRELYLQILPEGTQIGFLFFFRLGLVEIANWIVPLVLVGLVCWMVGIGARFSAIVVIANWLTLPVSYAYAVVLLVMMLMPGLAGLAVLLSFALALALVIALFRILRMVLGGHSLTIATVAMVLLVPTMILSEVLERYLGVYPG